MAAMPRGVRNAAGVDSPRAALATCAERPELTRDDTLLARALQRRGVATVPRPWDATVDWGGFSAVVLRSTWDYHLRIDAFHSWLDRLDASRVPVLNPTRIVRWNSHKGYLRDLRDRGVPILPTLWLGRGEQRTLENVLDETGWSEAVVKPAVSASAHDTWRTSRARADQDQAAFDAQLLAGDVLVQELAPEIASEGEWSLVFFGPVWSHAVLKRPAPGDFRVQEELGGTPQSLVPPPALVGQAERILAGLPAMPAYARVDGVARGGRLLLMELELIEPALYLGTSAGAADRFADAVLDTLRPM
jgi:hypothetical protein